jgi:alginate O-acetyltransferase complex protein AlgI
MLFHSSIFLFLFLPTVLAVFHLLTRYGTDRSKVAWLVSASLFFYGWWNVALLPLLLGSMAINYSLGLALAAKPRRWLLALGVALNLFAIGFFKYAGFFVEIFNLLSAMNVPVPQIVLPLAISFYTFQQIAFIVDCHDGRIKNPNPLRYALFMVYFPQLIAGPIVHYREIMPQIERPETFRIDSGKLALGFTVFVIGLFKKILLADTLAPLAMPAFNYAADGMMVAPLVAWHSVIAFALQLYFDFSGYSDMAIGLALMFGLLLPFNFASPYKSRNIIEFWARWHMTLTRFLTAYVYNPLTTRLMRRRMQRGKAVFNRARPAPGPFLVLLAVPTLFTMGLAGLWHGAGWQFIAFGLIHGLLLVLNHAWHATAGWRGPAFLPDGVLRPLQVLATFLAVAVSLVFFKAVSLEQALIVVGSLAGLGGLDGPGFVLRSQTLMIVGGLVIVWALPNTQQFVGLVPRQPERPTEPEQAASNAKARGSWLAWSPRAVQGYIVGSVLCLVLLRALGSPPAEFLYFAF